MSSGSDDHPPAPRPRRIGRREVKVEDQVTPSPSSPRPGKTPLSATPPAPVGQFLRDAYRDTLEEGVPDDMMDLLRKLN